MMVRFKEYLTESTKGYDWGAYRKVADRLDGRRKESYLKAIDAFERGFAAKEIYNADFKDHYSYGFSRGLEEVWDKLRDEEYYPKLREWHNNAGGKIPPEHISVASLFAVNSIKKMNRDWSKHKDHYPKVVAFLKSLESAPEMVKELKTHIKMGRKVDPNSKTEVAKAAFQAVVGRGAATKISQILHQTIDGIRNQYEKVFHEQLKRRLDAILKNENKYREIAVKKLGPRYTQHWWYGIENMSDKILMQDVMDHDTNKLKADWNSILEKQAKQNVNNILDGFVAKNTRKLAMIVDKKHNLKGIKIVRNRIHQGNLDNELYFEFGDGSHFTVYSQTIYKYSHRGLLFTQYPTRFRNVMLSNGQKLPGATEESMNKFFK